MFENDLCVHLHKYFSYESLNSIKLKQYGEQSLHYVQQGDREEVCSNGFSTINSVLEETQRFQQ